MSKAQRSKNICLHHTLTITISPHALQTKYKQPTQRQRINAMKPNPTRNIPEPSSRTDLEKFPPPLILPDDDLALNLDQPAQSFQKWHDMKTRNRVTAERRTIYLIPPPGYQASEQLAKASHEDTIDYLSAFYTGLTVKPLQIPNWNFHPRTEGKMPKRGQKRFDGRHPIAYAICMLIDHDLYEDEEDTFTCGRAYGRRRVSIVPTARYNPLLDEEQFAEREHSWPASHCTEYIQSLCDTVELAPKKQKISSEIAHCTYYSCIMQGSASLSEDARQPPELCPVDLAKLLFATGSSVRERYEVLLEFCEREGVKDGAGFAALRGWLGASMRILYGEGREG
ncbi:hypothetical protein BJX70DRAFT_391203 [Aspergillus crustosus]